MSNKVRHIDYYPDEYIAGVGGSMSAEKQGVFWMVCSLIMSHGGEVENDAKRIGRLVCLGAAKTRRVIDELIFEQKLFVNGSKLTQKRSINELKKAQKRIEIAEKNGALGGRPPKENNDLQKGVGLSDEKLTTNHQPPTTNQVDTIVSIKPVKPKRGSRIPDDWRPSDADRETARTEGFDEGQIDRLGACFVDYWQACAKNNTKLDWSATWRNYVRGDIAKRQAGNNGYNGGGHGAQGKVGGTIGAAQSILDDWRKEDQR